MSKLNPFAGPLEGRDVPTFIALDFDGTTIDAGESLDALLAALVEAHDPDALEEIVVWRDESVVVAVVKADGTVIRCEPTKALPATNDKPRRRK